VLSSHDETRHITRFGRSDTSSVVIGFDNGARGTDLALGTRRARAAALLTLALPGGAYIYQGEELGLAEVEDLPEAALQDPIWERSGHTVRGRDGCRVPLPWAGSAPPFGFSASGAQPWLPQPAGWAELTIEAQAADPESMLSLYRAALALRREQPGWHAAEFRWMQTPPGVLAFERGSGLRCIVNLSESPYSIAGLGQAMLSSVMMSGTDLPPDTAVWLRVADQEEQRTTRQ
jgi:alpha-glucosidase